MQCNGIRWALVDQRFLYYTHAFYDRWFWHSIELQGREMKGNELNSVLNWCQRNALASTLIARKKKKSLDFFLIFISLCLSVVKQIYLRHFLAKLPWLICVLEQSLLLLYQLKVKITRDERARKLISIQMKIIPINADKITNGGPCGPTTKAICSITCFTISD